MLLGSGAADGIGAECAAFMALRVVCVYPRRREKFSVCYAVLELLSGQDGT